MFLLYNFFSLISSNNVVAQDYIISGNHIYYNNSYANIDVYPYMDNNIINHTQYCNFTWNKNNSRVDLAFCFDKPLNYYKDFLVWKNFSHVVEVPIIVNYTSYYTLNGISNFVQLQEVPVSVIFGDIPSLKYYSGNALINGTTKSIIIGFDSFIWLNPQHTIANFTYHFLQITGSDTQNKFYFDWFSIKDKFDYKMYNNKNYYIFGGIDVEYNKKYITKWIYHLPVNDEGKWELLIKLSSDSVDSAYSSGRYAKLDPWYDSNFKYYKTLTMLNPVLDYCFKFNVRKVSSSFGISNSFNCSNHCNDNFSDLRFVYDNITEFPYWIQNYTSGVQATVWVKMSSNVSNFEVFYGNSVAAPVSSGNDTFLFFDDFKASSIDTGIWEQSGLTTPSTVSFGSSWISMEKTGNGKYGYNSIVDLSKPYIIETRISYLTAKSYSGWVSTFWVDYNNFCGWTANGADSVSAMSKEGGTSTLDATTYAWNNAQIYLATVKWKAGEVKYYIDGVLDETITTNVLADASSSVGIVLNSGSVSGSNYMSWDWIFARVYTTGIETTFSSITSEINRRPSPPSNINCYTLKNNTIYINWTIGYKASHTKIRMNNTWYPNILDTLIYNGTSDHFYYTSTSINNNYFFLAYSYNLSLNIDSVSPYIYCHETTFGYGLLNHYENIINATGTHSHNSPSIRGNYSIWANYTGNTTPLNIFENIGNAFGTHDNILNGTGYWVWANYTSSSYSIQNIFNATGTNDIYFNGTTWISYANYTGNNTPITLYENIINATGLHDYILNGTGYYVWANYTGNTTGLVVVENIVNATGTHEYQYRPNLGVSGEWWVWANYTGNSSGGIPVNGTYLVTINLSGIVGFINWTGYYNSSSEDISFNVSGNASLIATADVNISDDYLYIAGIDIEPTFLLLSVFFALFYFWWKSESIAMMYLLTMLIIPYSIVVIVVYLLPLYIVDVNILLFMRLIFLMLTVGIGGYTIDRRAKFKKIGHQ
jgi:hypothetical protein